MTTTLATLGVFGDGVDFLVRERPGRGGGDIGGLEATLELLWGHIKLSIAAMLLACAVALPLGLVLGHTGRGGFIATSVANIGRAVPSIALIFVFFAWFGAGFVNVMVALALLAIPPILTNTYVGMREVERDVVDAGRGMGMSAWTLIRSVELPLALPLIMAGLRVSAVNVVATATIAPLAGYATTLGDPIINFGVYGEAGRVGAAMLVALVAIATELGFAAAQRAVTPDGIKVSRGTQRRRLTVPNRRVPTTP
ncbi:MAG: ABC transporter permease [Solirubrobacteraceae bacterium]|nr:ABC transporter permease [Solirubrobacteraceae bacterium]